MEVITMQSEAYKELISSIEEIKKRLSLKEKDIKDKWLDNEEFMQMLKISKRTAQNYRDCGKISFSQIGGKIFYRESDIQKFLEKHYIKSHSK